MTIENLALQVFAAIGGITTVTFIMKIIIEKSLSARFDKGLETLKKDLLLEIRSFESNIHLEQERHKRTIELEYKIYPEIWRMLNTANIAAIESVSLFQQYTDVTDLAASALSDLLDQQKIPKASTLLASNGHQRQQIYTKLVNTQRLINAFNAYNDFNTFYQQQKIFIDPVTEAKIDACTLALRGALIEHQIYEFKWGGKN